MNPNGFASYLEATCQKVGLEKKTLLIKKGDVLLWYAALSHGGDEIRNTALTHKSFMCHYSSVKLIATTVRAQLLKPSAEPLTMPTYL